MSPAPGDAWRKYHQFPCSARAESRCIVRVRKAVPRRCGGRKATDAYDTYKTVSNPCLSAARKAAAVGLLAAGLFLPGGGYGAIDNIITKADDIPVRTIVDKSWKDKVQGRAQKTGTDGHQFRTYREAIALAKDPNVVRVHLDHGYNWALGLDPRTISPNRRPDVTGIYADGRVARVEVKSNSDRPNILLNRNSNLDNQIRAAGYTPLPPRLVVPTSGRGP
jgi:hypothetical protein